MIYRIILLSIEKLFFHIHAAIWKGKKYRPRSVLQVSYGPYLKLAQKKKNENNILPDTY